MSICITPKTSLDWPTDDASLTKIKINCIGENFVAYNLRRKNLIPFLPKHLQKSTCNGSQKESLVNGSASENGSDDKKTKKSVNLLELSEKKLEKATFYDVLDIHMHATPDSLRKAYHKACLKYHPDKTGRGEDDNVFLKIKEAFDTLSDPTKRRSYDSSMDFDDSIPKEGVKPKKFFDVYGPVFTRNLRFAVHSTDNDVDSNNKNGKKGKGGKKKGKNNSKDASKKIEPPTLGDINTPIEQVHAFYEYWTHFDSWRDFTLIASKSTEHDVDSAECREEKRWMEKEIKNKAKKLKNQEVLRIQTLVERAMAADPRLKMEKERLANEKKEKEEARKKKQEDERKKKEAEEEKLRLEKENREQKEKMAKAEAKLSKEKQKKALRKAKQAFRKLTIALFQQNDGNKDNWKNLDEMNDDVEFLCSHLSVDDLQYLNSLLDGDDDTVNNTALPDIRSCVDETKESVKSQKAIKIKKRDAARVADKEKAQKEKAAASMKPWSKDELSALAKAVKKYPPGGANRWETIALFVNNLCKPEDPRTKENCIEAYNILASNAENKLASLTGTSGRSAGPDGSTNGTNEEDKWTEEQDKKLQDGLKKYPASMDKNERWSAIAKTVDGRTKKECVKRFKEIREALKKSKVSA